MRNVVRVLFLFLNDKDMVPRTNILMCLCVVFCVCAWSCVPTRRFESHPREASLCVRGCSQEWCVWESVKLLDKLVSNFRVSAADHGQGIHPTRPVCGLTHPARQSQAHTTQDKWHGGSPVTSGGGNTNTATAICHVSCRNLQPSPVRPLDTNSSPLHLHSGP